MVPQDIYIVVDHQLVKRHTLTIMAETNTSTIQPKAEKHTSRLTAFTEWINMKKVLMGYTLLFVLYLYLPMISLFLFSLNAGGLTFPVTAFTLDWYYQLFSNTKLISAIVFSLKLAAVTTVITTILSTAAALAYRREFRGKRVLLYVFILGIIVPGVTYGISSLLLFQEFLNLSAGFWLAVPVEVVWTFPFGLIILLAGFPPNLAENERAARVMGASPWTVFKQITFPQIWPTILGSALFAFTLAYNETSRSILLTGSRSTMSNQVFVITNQISPTPELFALGSITTVISTVLLLAAALLIFDFPTPFGE